MSLISFLPPVMDSFTVMDISTATLVSNYFSTLLSYPPIQSILQAVMSHSLNAKILSCYSFWELPHSLACFSSVMWKHSFSSLVLSSLRPFSSQNASDAFSMNFWKTSHIQLNSPCLNLITLISSCFIYTCSLCQIIIRFMAGNKSYHFCPCSTLARIQ